MQDIAVKFEKHCWIHSVSLFPPQVHVGRSPKLILDIDEIINDKNPHRTYTEYVFSLKERIENGEFD
ncbi:hypothetical protein [Spiroplasma endosymbiont of Apeira syringaria]|uniref:hypothetical protein n=1 Tax=Spiroplasma endosymbiont of Apeira syringaria TaxID=3066307 RepID=UPI0030CE72B1